MVLAVPAHTASHATHPPASHTATTRSPFAGIYAVWQCTCVNSKSDVPVWILVIGGVGIVLGLATYGEWNEGLRLPLPSRHCHNPCRCQATHAPMV
jgi:hypothetical protein